MNATDFRPQVNSLWLVVVDGRYGFAKVLEGDGILFGLNSEHRNFGDVQKWIDEVRTAQETDYID